MGSTADMAIQRARENNFPSLTLATPAGHNLGSQLDCQTQRTRRSKLEDDREQRGRSFAE
jgi:hypothetical protein